MRKRLTYRDKDRRARLTLFGKQMYCSTQATADCFAELEEAIPQSVEDFKSSLVEKINASEKFFDKKELITFVNDCFEAFYDENLKKCDDSKEI